MANGKRGRKRIHADTKAKQKAVRQYLVNKIAKLAPEVRIHKAAFRLANWWDKVGSKQSRSECAPFGPRMYRCLPKAEKQKAYTQATLIWFKRYKKNGGKEIANMKLAIVKVLGK